MKRLCALALAAAGCSADPCAGHSSCIVLDLTDDTGTVRSPIDLLAVALTDASGMLSGRASSPGARTLPLETAVFLPDRTQGSFAVAVTASLGQLVVGAGAAPAPVEVAVGVPGKAVVDLVGPAPGDGGPPDRAGEDLAGVDLAGGDLAADLDGAPPPSDLSGGCWNGGLFCDDFESLSFNRWNPGLSASINMVTLQEQAMVGAHATTGAISFVPQSTFTGSQYVTTQAFNFSSGTYFFRFWVLASATPQGDYWSLLRLSDNLEVVLRHDCSGVDGTWAIWDGAAPHCMATSIGAGQWHCVELQVYIDPNMGFATLYVDGAQVAIFLPAAIGAVNSIDFGMVHTPGNQSLTFTFDDFEIDQVNQLGLCP